MPKKKKKGKKKRKKKKGSGKSSKSQVKIMSLGDIEKRFVKTCSKAILSCDTLVLNLKNHKEALRVETKAIDKIRTLYMDALTNRYIADKDIEDLHILETALERYLNVEKFLSRAETMCMSCPLEVMPKLFYVPLREAFSSVYDILDQRATMCNRRLLLLTKFSDIWNIVFKEYAQLQEMSKTLFTKFLSYRVLCQKHCGAGAIRPNHELRLQKSWGGSRARRPAYGKLTIATKQGDFKKCLHLLTQGCNPNEIEERSGAAPLHHASWNGNVDISALLITRGAFVNAQTLRGFTPLHFAYENHHYELISLLITNGADPNIKSSLGTTPSEMKNARKHMFPIQQRIKAHAKEVKKDMMQLWEEPVKSTRKHADIAKEAAHKFKQLIKSSGGPGGSESKTEHLPDIVPETGETKSENAEAPAPDTKGNQQLPNQSLGGPTSQKSNPAIDKDARVTGPRRGTSRRPADEVTAAATADDWSQLAKTPGDSRPPVETSEVVRTLGDSGKKGVVGPAKVKMAR